MNWQRVHLNKWLVYIIRSTCCGWVRILIDLYVWNAFVNFKIWQIHAICPLLWIRFAFVVLSFVSAHSIIIPSIMPIASSSIMALFSSFFFLCSSRSMSYFFSFLSSRSMQRQRRRPTTTITQMASNSTISSGHSKVAKLNILILNLLWLMMLFYYYWCYAPILLC